MKKYLIVAVLSLLAIGVPIGVYLFLKNDSEVRKAKKDEYIVKLQYIVDSSDRMLSMFYSTDPDDYVGHQAKEKEILTKVNSISVTLDDTDSKLVDDWISSASDIAKVGCQCLGLYTYETLKPGYEATASIENTRDKLKGRIDLLNSQN